MSAKVLIAAVGGVWQVAWIAVLTDTPGNRPSGTENRARYGEAAAAPVPGSYVSAHLAVGPVYQEELVRFTCAGPFPAVFVQAWFFWSAGDVYTCVRQAPSASCPK